MKIVTDSAADLPIEEAQAMGIAVAPLYIQFPEGEVRSSDISADEFYRRLEAVQPFIPTTAQPSEKVFGELYRSVSAPGEEILSIHISSGLSGTINSARLAAEQTTDRPVHLIDTMTLSGGQRFQVLAAAQAARQGCSVQEITQRLSQIREQSEVIYTLETLKYLARGGRIGRVQALAGSLLQIKPLIRVAHEDGKYSTAGRARSIRRALDEIVNYLGGVFSDGKNLWITVLHGNLQAPADELAELAEKKLKVGKLEILRISPVLGVHTGPGVVGAAAVPLHLMEAML